MRLNIKELIKVSEGVTVNHANNLLTVQGKNGTLERKAIIPKIKIYQEENKVFIETKDGSKREKTLVKTYKAHLKNMIKGVTEGHTYKLKICSGHFPMTATLKGQSFEIKNFIGEKVPRLVSIPEGVKAKLDAEIIILEGNNKELVGIAAGKIEKMTKRPGFDKRIFQDGIYIIEKDGKAL